MSNKTPRITPFYGAKSYKRAKNNKADEADRRSATIDLFKEMWVMLFWPFGVLGLLVFGLPGLTIGMGIGAFFLSLFLLEMRYGRAL